MQYPYAEEGERQEPEPVVQAIEGKRSTGARDSRAQAGHVRGVLFACIAANVLYFPFDLAWPRPARLVGVRLVWIATLLLAATFQRSSRWGRPAYLAACLLSALLGVASVDLSSGIAGSRGAFVTALPLAIIMLVPEEPLGAFLAAGASTIGGVVLWVRAGASISTVLDWTMLNVVLAGLVAFGAREFRRLWRDRLDAERQRSEALEQLRASEQERLAAENDVRLALIAGEMAHEINNPLQAASTNVEYLAEELGAAGRLPAGVGDAVTDAHAGLARIHDVVHDLTAAAERASSLDARLYVDQAVARGLSLATARCPPLRVQVTCGEGLRVLGDPELAALAVMHLALAVHADGQRPVEIVATRDGEDVVVRFAPVEGAGAGARDRARARQMPLLLAGVLARRCGGAVERLSQGGWGLRLLASVSGVPSQGSSPRAECG